MPESEVTGQLPFEFGDLHALGGQKVAVTRLLRGKLLDFYATVLTVGPEHSVSKSAVLGTVEDLDARLIKFLDSIFE